ncbi:MAG TPA: hypothetical protein VE619_08195 [Nitrososphaeraceae archaeon]|nr:hypothetical protein [Nitrososphaeraceae archaeon]
MNKKNSIIELGKTSKLSILIAPMALIAILLSTTIVCIEALPQVHGHTTMAYSHQQYSGSSSDVKSNNNVFVHTNSADPGDVAGSSSRSNSIGTMGTFGTMGNIGNSDNNGNLNSNIKSIIASLDNDINKMVQQNIQGGAISTSSSGTSKVFSGKIAGSQVDLKSGNVERVLFGDWSLDPKKTTASNFLAKFAVRASSEGSKQPNPGSDKLIAVGSYSLNNLKVNSIQQQNKDITLMGTVNLSVIHDGGSTTQSWKDIPLTIEITNQHSVIIISFDKNSAASSIFHNFPIIGVVTSNSLSTSS